MSSHTGRTSCKCSTELSSSLSSSPQKHDYYQQELYGGRDGRSGLPVPNSPYGLCGRKATLNYKFRAQELCESRGGRPGLPVSNSLYGLYGRKATLNYLRAQELCGSRGGRPGLPVLIAPTHPPTPPTPPRP